MLQTEIDWKCELCQQHDGDVRPHYICMSNSGKAIMLTYDRLCSQLHFSIFKGTGEKLDKEHCYDCVPESVQINNEDKVTVCLNQ
jgi:hypothetical protein